MKHLALFIMSIVLKNAKKEKVGKDPIVQRAYDSMIETYEHTIMFLKANIDGTKNKPSNKRCIRHLMSSHTLRL